MSFSSILCFVCRLPGGAWLLRVAMRARWWDADALDVAQIKREIERHLRRRGLSRSAATKQAGEWLARTTN